MSTPKLDIDSLIDDPLIRIIVCTGSGGVGKTSTAAALAIRAAERGRKVCVLTIDPAKRLAQAMGLSALDNSPRPVSGVSYGSLEAMMLDMKRTFDEVVEAHADPERAAQILSNPFYQALSSSFAGTQEYMAMEKLGQLRATADVDGTWDLIVVDTPPSRSALDFLDAPARLGSFLDGRFIRILSAPARGAGRGSVAVEVGRRLSRLAAHAQVIVVTHLPQVAAFADTHLVVERATDGDTGRRTHVTEVHGEQRVTELVRMLSGLSESDSGAAHARELLGVAGKAI